jgi:ribosomal protein S15P/S13E
LKEEEVCDCYHPSEQSTSSPHATSIAEADVCLMSQEKKNPTRVNDFLLESHERQEELLIEKIKELKTLTKEHEKHKDSHASLVSRYEKNII